MVNCRLHISPADFVTVGLGSNARRNTTIYLGFFFNFSKITRTFFFFNENIKQNKKTSVYSLFFLCFYVLNWIKVGNSLTRIKKNL